MSSAARPDLPPEKLAEIVDEIIARRPWFGVWYLLVYPFRRFPLFFFTVLPCQALHQPPLLILVLAAVTLWADWRFVPRWSWDMGPQLPEFVAKICREEVIPPVLTKRDWKAIRKAALYVLPLLAAVAAGTIATGIHLEQAGQTGGAAAVALKYLWLAILYLIFSPVLVGVSYFWPLARFPFTRPELEGPKCRPGHFDIKKLHEGYYVDDVRHLLANIIWPVIMMASLYAIGSVDVFEVEYYIFIIASFSFIALWTLTFLILHSVRVRKARSIASEYLRLVKAPGDQPSPITGVKGDP